MKKRISITGGVGFSGAPVVDRLLALGHEVASYDSFLNFIDNEAYYKQCLKIRRKYYAQPAKIYRGDIRNEKQLEKAVKDFRPHVIVHLAGLSMARPLKKYEDQVVPINFT